MLKAPCPIPITRRKRADALVVQENDQATSLKKKLSLIGGVDQLPVAFVTNRAVFVVLILGEGAFRELHPPGLIAVVNLAVRGLRIIVAARIPGDAIHDQQAEHEPDHEAEHGRRHAPR